MNCRDCKHWQLRETLKLVPDLAKQGFAKCAVAPQYRKATFFSAGHLCNSYEPAPEEAVAARKKVMGEQ